MRKVAVLWYEAKRSLESKGNRRDGLLALHIDIIQRGGDEEAALGYR